MHRISAPSALGLIQRHFFRPAALGLLLAASLVNLPAASSWDGKAPVEYVLSVETDKPDAIYQQGDTVTFNIQLQHNQQPATEGSVDWVISKDGVPPLEKGTAQLVDGKASITGKLGEPGFLHCEVTYKHEKDKFVALAGAAIDPLAIRQALPCPADFDEFWAAKKKALAAVPMDPQLTSVPMPADRPGPAVECFDVKLASIGAPVSGYYARPIGAKPKSCPARLCVPGAGVRSADLTSAVRYAQKGVISMDINAHGILNGQPPAYYAGLDAGELKDYRTRGRESRDTYYFLGAHLRTLRALEFLKSQPEWDGHTLVIEGGSQGGGLAFAGAALDPQVTFFVALVPALCDHGGLAIGRISGWPKVVPLTPDGKPDPAVLEASRYFDSANFAARIKAPCFSWVGFLDVTCPPTSNYAALNNLTGQKEIVNDPSHGHGTDGTKVWPKVAQVISDHLAEQAKTKPAPAQ